VFFHHLRVFLYGVVHVHEHDAFLFEVFADVVVDRSAVILCAGSSEAFLFGFGDAEAFEGFFDFVWDVLPVSAVFISVWDHEVCYFFEA
jgi:hypothetical protein